MTDPDESVGQAIEHDLSAAINEVIARYERSLVTKWVALVETIDEDGARGMWPLTSEGVKSWESTGMLLYGLQVQQAAIVVDALRRE